jgi:hypothetical protein
MKNYAIIALVACVAFVTLAATPSHAQALMKADVPFSFSAGYGVLPVGEYNISRTGFGQTILLSNGRRGVELMTPNTTDWQENFRTPKLVFHRYGDEYFLAEIWTSADDCVRTLSVHPRERQLAKAGVSPQVAVVYGVLASARGN